MDSAPLPDGIAPLGYSLVVCGWQPHTLARLEALAAHGYRLMAVGDRGGTALVTARHQTGRPCYQHPLEMLGRVRAHTALIDTGDPHEAAEAVVTAADHGLAILLDGTVATADTLSAARQSGARLALLRPRWQHPVLAAARDLSARHAVGRLTHITLEVATALGGVEAIAEMAPLVGRIARRRVSGARVVDASTIHIQFGPDLAATLRIHLDGSDRCTLLLAGDTGAIEADTADCTVTRHTASGTAVQQLPTRHARSTQAMEIERAVQELGAGGARAAALRADEVLLRAIDDATAEHAGMHAHARPRLRLIAGGAAGHEARTSHLHLVS